MNHKKMRWKLDNQWTRWHKKHVLWLSQKNLREVLKAFAFCAHESAKGAPRTLRGISADHRCISEDLGGFQGRFRGFQLRSRSLNWFARVLRSVFRVLEVPGGLRGISRDLKEVPGGLRTSRRLMEEKNFSGYQGHFKRILKGQIGISGRLVGLWGIPMSL